MNPLPLFLSFPDCGSKNTSELIFVSHSCSKAQLEFIFRALLPELNDSHTVLDVGSRLGAVIYGAHLFSGAGKIVGIEMNQELCEVQNRVIQMFNFGARASVIHADMMTCSDHFSSADVVVLNNVFEWFSDIDQQKTMWRFLCSHVKVGALLVTVPSLETSFYNLRIAMELNSWVRPLKQTRAGLIVNDENDVFESKIFLYQVVTHPAMQNGINDCNMAS